MTKDPSIIIDFDKERNVIHFYLYCKTPLIIKGEIKDLTALKSTQVKLFVMTRINYSVSFTFTSDYKLISHNRILKTQLLIRTGANGKISNRRFSLIVLIEFS